MNKNHDFLKKSIAIILVTLLALMIRVSFFQNTKYHYPIQSDSANYVVYAENIQNFSTFSKDTKNTPPVPDSFWAPGYSFFLSGILALSTEQHRYSNILLAQAIIGALTCLITMLLAGLFLKYVWVIISGLLVALSPHLITLGSLVLTESLFSFSLILSLYLIALSLNKQSRMILIMAAISFGISYLINPVMFFTPIFISPFLYLFLAKNNKKRAQNSTALFLIAFLLIPSAWSLRNQLNVPSDALSGSDRLLINMVIGAHSNYYEIYRQNPRNPDNPATIDLAKINGSFTLFLEIMKERIAADPIHYAQWYFLKKPLLLWNWNILAGQGDIFVYPIKFSLYQKSRAALASYSIMKSLHYWLFSFAILSIIFYVKESNRNSENNVIFIMIYITAFYISSVCVLAQSEARYSIPLRPEMYLCAVFFISKVFSYLKLKSSSIN
jgi:4-amino-4-deoxy-L-arabinose transferase-like glycosyltransferase